MNISRHIYTGFLAAALMLASVAAPAADTPIYIRKQPPQNSAPVTPPAADANSSPSIYLRKDPEAARLPVPKTQVYVPAPAQSTGTVTANVSKKRKSKKAAPAQFKPTPTIIPANLLREPVMPVCTQEKMNKLKSFEKQLGVAFDEQKHSREIKQGSITRVLSAQDVMMDLYSSCGSYLPQKTNPRRDMATQKAFMKILTAQIKPK